MATASNPTTVVYKHTETGAPVLFDLYLPTSVGGAQNADESGAHRTPTVIFFHGGGLHVGNKEAIPLWLIKRVLASGCALISPNYQLLPPATGHDIVQDIKDLFAYVATHEVAAGPHIFRADPDRLAVAGASSGGHCAYLAAAHAVPKPKAVLSIYAPGGNFLTPQYVKQKREPFFMGQPLLNVDEFADFIYPFPNGPLEPTSDVPVVFGSPTVTRRMSMAPLYLQLGSYLDYYTGMHMPSLSSYLDRYLDDDGTVGGPALEHSIPEKERPLFPQLLVDASWPPTLFMHSPADTAVHIAQSEHLHKVVVEAKVTTEFIRVPDMEHLADNAPDAEEKWGTAFDSCVAFVTKHLGVTN